MKNTAEDAVLDFLNGTASIPYVPDFLTPAEADALFAFLKTLPHERRKNPRNRFMMRRVSYRGWSPFPKSHSGYETLPLSSMPDEIKALQAKLTAYAGKEINYLSVIGYENEKDHMNWHQHKEDKRPIHCEDMTVWVVNLGEVRTIGIRPVGSKDKSQYEYLHPKHGSLYVLPSEYNNTHEHAVLDDEFPCALRISINCKHIPPQTPPPSGKKPAKKKSRDKDSIYKPVNGDGPYIYCQRVGYTYPADAVNVDRKTIFGNLNYHKLSTESGRADWAAEVEEKMKPPEFRAQVESLRGKDLLCWCRPNEREHCHAKVWLELANAMTTNAAVVTPEPDPPEPSKRKQAASTAKIPTFGYPGGKATAGKAHRSDAAPR